MAYEKYKYGYIYITTNLINGKKYIGKRARKVQETKYFGSGTLINRAINKYGIENFRCDIIRWCYSKKECSEMEKFYIQYYNAIKSDSYYNIAEGGIGGNTYAGKSEDEMKEISEKISKGLSGDNNGNKGQYKGPKNSMYGKHWDEAHRKLFSNLSKKPKNIYNIIISNKNTNEVLTFESKSPHRLISKLIGDEINTISCNRPFTRYPKNSIETDNFKIISDRIEEKV